MKNTKYSSRQRFNVLWKLCLLFKKWKVLRVPTQARLVLLWNLALVLFNNVSKQLCTNFLQISDCVHVSLSLFFWILFISENKTNERNFWSIDSDKKNKFTKFERIVINFLLKCQQGLWKAWTKKKFNKIIIKTRQAFKCYKIAVQPNLFKWPPLWDNHSSKTTNAESVQANSHAIITV